MAFTKPRHAKACEHSHYRDWTAGVTEISAALFYLKLRFHVKVPDLRLLYAITFFTNEEWSLQRCATRIQWIYTTRRNTCIRDKRIDTCYNIPILFGIWKFHTHSREFNIHSTYLLLNCRGLFTICIHLISVSGIEYYEGKWCTKKSHSSVKS